jgi:hypothetical protein
MARNIASPRSACPTLLPHYRIGETRHYISPWARALVTLPVGV